MSKHGIQYFVATGVITDIHFLFRGVCRVQEMLFVLFLSFLSVACLKVCCPCLCVILPINTSFLVILLVASKNCPLTWVVLVRCAMEARGGEVAVFATGVVS